MATVTKAGIFILWLLKQAGEAYRYGAEYPLLQEDLANPYAFPKADEWDCSELVQGGLWAAGVTHVGTLRLQSFDGAGNQYFNSRPISMDVAWKTPGALVFVQDRGSYPNKPGGVGHVGVVICQDHCIEARGTKYGVVLSRRVDRSFNIASKVDALYE